MPKVTLDRETFKALASDTRLDILRTLDGKKMSLNDISKATKLNKATLHEHLAKLNEAGLIKRREREGHKWVYYKLTWKGEGLLHPENTRIVVLFTTTFVILWVGIFQLYYYIKGTITNIGYDIYRVGSEVVMTKSGEADGIVDALTNTTTNTTGIGGVTYGWRSIFDLDGGFGEFLDHNVASSSGTNSTSIPIPDGNLSLIGTEGGTLPPIGGEETTLVVDQSRGVIQALSQDSTLLYIAIACFIIFTVVLCIGLWRLWENKSQKL